MAVCLIITSIRPPAKKLSLRLIGFLFIMRGSDFSFASERPGKPSASTLTMSIIMGVSGMPHPETIPKIMIMTSEILHTIRK
jgi:hypothetical protein